MKIPAPDHCPVQGQGGGVGFDVSISLIKQQIWFKWGEEKKSIKDYYQNKLY